MHSKKWKDTGLKDKFMEGGNVFEAGMFGGMIAVTFEDDF